MASICFCVLLGGLTFFWFAAFKPIYVVFVLLVRLIISVLLAFFSERLNPGDRRRHVLRFVLANAFVVTIGLILALWMWATLSHEAPKLLPISGDLQLVAAFFLVPVIDVLGWMPGLGYSPNGPNRPPIQSGKNGQLSTKPSSVIARRNHQMIAASLQRESCAP